MDAHSMMLEHTLVMAGECVDTGSVWQGWPSKSQSSLLQHRSKVSSMLLRAARGDMTITNTRVTSAYRRNRQQEKNKEDDRLVSFESDPLLPKGPMKKYGSEANV